MIKHEDERAFPVTMQDSQGYSVTILGMTLRDYFAAKALESIAGTMGDIFEPHAQDELAGSCYKIADAMLAERAK